jgi:Nucleosome assembly protein (NAP)
MERIDDNSSFFNFFSNLKTPTEEEIKNIDIETERDLGAHFDTEYEIGLELVDEIIPNASEFFVGVDVDFDEYHQYASDLINKKF